MNNLEILLDDLYDKIEDDDYYMFDRENSPFRVFSSTYSGIIQLEKRNEDSFSIIHIF